MHYKRDPPTRVKPPRRIILLLCNPTASLTRRAQAQPTVEGPVFDSYRSGAATFAGVYRLLPGRGRKSVWLFVAFGHCAAPGWCKRAVWPGIPPGSAQCGRWFESATSFFSRSLQAPPARPMEHETLLLVANPLMSGTGGNVTTPEPVRLSAGTRRKSRVSLQLPVASVAESGPNAPPTTTDIQTGVPASPTASLAVAGPAPVQALSPMRRNNSKPLKGLSQRAMCLHCPPRVMY